MAGEAKAKKRTSKVADPENEDLRKRGRPRVDSQDESAVDRRRTQIRLAQRAYRQRKESTLDDLRKRVSDLTSTMELMNRAFLDCQTRVERAGLTTSQLRDFQETQFEFERLLRSIRNTEDSNTDESESNSQQASQKDQDASEKALVPVPKNVSSWMDDLAISQAAKITPGSYMGYTLPTQTNNATSAPEVLYGAQDHMANMFNPSQDRSSPFNPLPMNANAASRLSLPAQVRPPRTYSFEETTFGRRLHRICLEQCYQLLLDPTRRPKVNERVFKLSLLWHDREKLIATIRNILDQGPEQPLELRSGAAIHVGGAGTHYPRRDQFGNLQPIRKPYNAGVISPSTLAILENAAQDPTLSNMAVEIVGYEGEWFDPYDVEGYLLEKGIFIDPSASFIDAEIDDPATTQPRDTDTDGSAGAQTIDGSSPASRSSLITPDSMAMENNQQFLFAQGHTDLLDKGNVGSTMNWQPDPNLSNMSDVGFSDAMTGSWMNFVDPADAASKLDLQMGEFNSWEGSRTSEFLPDMYQSPNLGANTSASIRQPITQANNAIAENRPRKKAIIIDVEKFVKLLTTAGVCIGRTPGFKRGDVDRALAMSSFNTFDSAP